MAFDWKNPYVLGGGALFLVILLFAGRSGSSTGNPAAAGVASQGIATGANVQLAELSAGVRQAQIQADSALSIYRAGADASIIGSAIGYLSNADANSTARYNMTTAYAMNSNDNLTATQLASIGQITQFGLSDRNLLMQSELDRTTIRVNGDNNDLMARLSPTLAQIQADTARSLAQTSANQAVSVAQISANTRSNELAAQAQGQTSNGLFGFLGNVASAILPAVAAAI